MRAATIVKRLGITGLTGVVCLLCAVASAQTRDRTVGTYASWGYWQGDAIARATARAQKEPGVTEELAPDAKQTATGGPVGGVPGFSGGR